MAPIYLLITASYIALVVGGLHMLKKHSKPDWWIGVILAAYTGIIVLVLKII